MLWGMIGAYCIELNQVPRSTRVYWASPELEAPDATSDGRSNNQIISASCEGQMTKNDLEKTLFILYGLIISREHGSGN
jgi:hypothetical protein